MRYLFLLLSLSPAFALAENAQEPPSAVEIRFWLDEFYTDCGRYPTIEEGLQALLVKPPKLKGWGPEPYARALPKDPWGRDWLYQSDGNTFDLISLGKDGREGGVGENADIDYHWPQ
jgi:type II secretion system protein G